MNHRHLLPTELDLLLDGEEGFGVAPLKAHVRQCADCQSRLEEARFVTDTLEELPRFAPSHDFASRVMSQVPVFVPWHVAARDSVRQWVPQSRPARIAALGFASGIAAVLTVGILWIATQTDMLVLATSLAGNRLRELVGGAAREVGVALFGDRTFVAIQQLGTPMLLVALLGLLGATTVAVFGLRAIAAASSRRRA